ncbi:OLC1v1004388C1 [Oldenlandia corymbosa var. corymbosa]|uniref:OLC1v1004388C1 n=1 Tax=Oldenlandia corymbosa var. corymbosa TaxID=529605 RepID=A0AAV1DC61_OLDCO|nr:OLC1v1004388C1 [Oldenlandia corymbosa var. corymbosa]
MDPTLIVDYINSSLVDLDFLVKRCSDHQDAQTLTKLRFGLRNLETFVLAARMLGKAVNLESFLSGIEDIVREKAADINDLSLNPGANLDLSVASEFQKDIQSLEQEMDEWYATMLDSSSQSSSSLEEKQVLEIITSIVENLLDIHSLEPKEGFHFQILEEAMEALAEQFRFLKTLLGFTSNGNDESRQDLLSHAELVTMDAAYLLFTFGNLEKFDEESCNPMNVNVSKLLQQIKPTDAQVYETYIQALSSTQLPTFIAMKSFLDSLISNLWELLVLNTDDLVVSMKDQLRELYECLRSLRSILKESTEGVKADIGGVVRDAGILICSLYQNRIDGGDLGLRNLLEGINTVLAKSGRKDPEEPTMFNFPRTNQLGYVDFVLEKLIEISISDVAEPTAKSCLQTIEEELSFLRSFLEVIVDMRHQQVELRSIWDRSLEMAQKVEDLIDHLVVGVSFPASFASITEDLENIKGDMVKISNQKRPEIKEKEAAKAQISSIPQQISPSTTTEVVGLDKEAASIKDRLLRGSPQLQVIYITGMPGLGKTTLAAKVYNDPSLLYHFDLRAWSPISQVVDRRRVLLELLNQVNPQRYAELTELDLAEKLRRTLKMRRYLIFLDDVWDIEAWNGLGFTFPDDKMGSRIILTSRHKDVAPPYLLDKPALSLEPLNEENSLKLLQTRLFPETSWPRTLHVLGMEIAKSCKGLPLTLVIVAGLLANTDQKEWKQISDRLSTGDVEIIKHCTNTLELSYKHLPEKLRPCLLYFGAFQEDQEISVNRLVRLWAAEGFIRKPDASKRVVDVAEEYLQDLIGRSLIMVVKQNYTKRVKSCRIHDLLHDFCSQKAKEERLFHFLREHDELLEFNEPRYLRRLCIQSEAEHFKDSKLFCPRARSLLINFSQKAGGEDDGMRLNISVMINMFKLLRVLDLERIDVGSRFPSEIEMLVQLVFLAIRGKMRHVPSSIGKLSNLETFIVVAGAEMVSLPENLWNLSKLKYLCIKGDSGDVGSSLPLENLDDPSTLWELDRFSGVIIPHWEMERLMRKFPKVRRLKCKFQFKLDAKSRQTVAVLDFKSQSELESLDMSFHEKRIPRNFKFDISLPDNLRKVTLSRIPLPWTNLSTIGQLQNLKVLKLIYISFEGEEWQMKDGEFSNLEILKLSSWELVRWTACEDQFAWLTKLELEGCRRLEKMPGCLPSTETLETIEVSDCCQTVVDLVKKIEREKKEWGDDGFKIRVGRIWEDPRKRNK